MTPARNLAAKRKAPHRSFRLIIDPDAGERFGVTIEETNGNLIG